MIKRNHRLVITWSIIVWVTPLIGQVPFNETPGASLDQTIFLKDGTLYIAWAEKFNKPLTSNTDIYFTTISVADY